MSVGSGYESSCSLALERVCPVDRHAIGDWLVASRGRRGRVAVLGSGAWPGECGPPADHDLVDASDHPLDPGRLPAGRERPVLGGRGDADTASGVRLLGCIVRCVRADARQCLAVATFQGRRRTPLRLTVRSNVSRRSRVRLGRGCWGVASLILRR